MQIQLGALVSEPWFVTALALAAVVGDALLPFLPSGSLVIAAALLSLDHGGAPIALAIAVAVASFLGDLVVVALARGGSARADVLLERHVKLASGAGRLSRHLARRLPAATVAGRFVPAGRTVLGLTLGAVPGQRARYLRWSAVGGLAWACYLVVLGVVNGLWFETRWIGFAVSTAAAITLSACLARSLRRRAAAEGSPASSSQAGGLEDSAGRVRVDATGEAPQIVIAGAQGSPRTGVPYALLHRAPQQRIAGQHARGDVHPAARVVAQEHPRGDAIGPLGGHEAVRAHRRAAEDPVGSDPPLPRAHPRWNQHHQQQRAQARPQCGPNRAEPAHARVRHEQQLEHQRRPCRAVPQFAGPVPLVDHPGPGAAPRGVRGGPGLYAVSRRTAFCPPAALHRCSPLPARTAVPSRKPPTGISA